MRGLWAIASLAASSALADGIAATPNYGESPRNMMIEIRVGPYKPLIDRAFPTLTTGPYAATFNDSLMLLGEAEIERQIFQRLGSLAIGVGVGYAEKYGRAIADATGLSTGEAVALKLVPMKALAVYRFDWLQIKYGVPIVPYVKAGIGVSYWLTTKGTSSPEVADNIPGQGVSYGFVGMAGAAFLLDILDPRLARDFDTGIGVNHTYAFAEFDFSEINDFGRKNSAGTLNALDLSSRYAMFGLAFEF